MLSDRLQLATSAAQIGVWEWNILANSVVWDETMWQLYQVPRVEPLTYELFRSALHPAPHRKQRASPSDRCDVHAIAFLHEGLTRSAVRLALHG
jgi:hypothetical protein